MGIIYLVSIKEIFHHLEINSSLFEYKCPGYYSTETDNIKPCALYNWEYMGHNIPSIYLNCLRTVDNIMFGSVSCLVRRSLKDLPGLRWVSFYWKSQANIE